MTRFYQVRIDDEKLAKAFDKRTPKRGDRQKVLLELIKKYVKGEVKI